MGRWPIFQHRMADYLDIDHRESGNGCPGRGQPHAAHLALVALRRFISACRALVAARFRAFASS
jgi:hypothetical protein